MFMSLGRRAHLLKYSWKLLNKCVHYVQFLAHNFLLTYWCSENLSSVMQLIIIQKHVRGESVTQPVCGDQVFLPPPLPHSRPPKMRGKWIGLRESASLTDSETVQPWFGWQLTNYSGLDAEVHPTCRCHREFTNQLLCAGEILTPTLPESHYIFWQPSNLKETERAFWHLTPPRSFVVSAQNYCIVRERLPPCTCTRELLGILDFLFWLYKSIERNTISLQPFCCCVRSE